MTTLLLWLASKLRFSKEQVTTAFIAAVLCVETNAVAFAQPAQMRTPTTKILAIGTINPGVDPAQVRDILPIEARETLELYLQGKIDQWFSLSGRMGVVFIVNSSDEEATHLMLEALPLGKAHLMTFSLMPLGPLAPLRFLGGARQAP